MKEEKNKVKEPAVPYGSGYTYGDYLEFQFDEMVELIRGKIYRMSPAPLSIHQLVLGSLYLEIGNCFRKSPCKVFIAPFDVVLPIPNRKAGKSSDTVVQPDICVICDSSKISRRGCFGAPDLVVEVLSPHTTKKDIQYKYEVYEESLVREYWVVNPRDEYITAYILKEGSYGRPIVYEHDHIISPSIFPELKIDLKDIFEEMDDLIE